MYDGAYTHAGVLLRAMWTGASVQSSSGVVGRLDECYRSVYGGGMRVRVCDKQGRVHHFDAADVKLNEAGPPGVRTAPPA